MGRFSQGGAVYATSYSEVYSNTSVIVDNSFFKDNYAFLDGGAVMADSFSDIESISTVYVNNSNFKGNNVPGYGAAIFSAAVSGGIGNHHAISKSGVIVERSNFEYNIAGLEGSAICSESIINSNNGTISFNSWIIANNNRFISNNSNADLYIRLSGQHPYLLHDNNAFSLINLNNNWWGSNNKPINRFTANESKGNYDISNWIMAKNPKFTVKKINGSYYMIADLEFLNNVGSGTVDDNFAKWCILTLNELSSEYGINIIGTPFLNEKIIYIPISIPENATIEGFLTTNFTIEFQPFTNIEIPINTSNETNNTPVDPDPLPTPDPEDPSDDVIDNPIPAPHPGDNGNGTNNSKLTSSNAAMKSTGNPIAMLLFVLLGAFVVLIRRK